MGVNETAESAECVPQYVVCKRPRLTYNEQSLNHLRAEKYVSNDPTLRSRGCQLFNFVKPNSLAPILSKWDVPCEGTNWTFLMQLTSLSLEERACLSGSGTEQ